jgi:hypothetical protein
VGTNKYRAGATRARPFSADSLLPTLPHFEDRAKQKKAQVQNLSLSQNNPGDDRLSHAVARAVPWALEGLASVFGMGTGVTPPV